MSPEEYRNLLKACVEDAKKRYRQTGCLAFKIIAERIEVIAERIEERLDDRSKTDC